jgi:CBS domain containing-hemolysin-like protein
MDVVFGLLAVFTLVFINGFFVAAEFALVGARRTRIAQLADEGNNSAKVASRAMEHLDNYIAATQLGITLASLGLGWIGEPAVAHLFEPLLHLVLPPESVETVGHTITLVLSFSLVTMLHIVLGELAPKAIALQRPESTALVVAQPATWFLRIFRPVIYVMNSVGNAVVRMLGFEPASGHAQVHSSEELVMLIHSSREAGILQESEERLLRRVFDFSDIYIEEVMQPRIEVDALPLDITLDELLQTLREQHHSRYPVFESSIDNTMGILYVKDLLNYMIENPALLNGGSGTFDIKPLLHEPLFVPQSISVDKVLERMQTQQMHLAVVLDEYGGVAGIATMEDILEELVGEVHDEFDEEVTGEVNQNTSILDGMTSITAAEERFGDLEEEVQSTTLGGYIAEKLERIPTVGDQAVFGNYTLTVEEMDGMRVSKIRFAPSTVSDPSE